MALRNNPLSKKYRVNIVIQYFKIEDIINYREPLHDIMRHLAWLYQFEYSIKENYPYPGVHDSNDQLIEDYSEDLIYFRSTDQTQISAKEFRKIALNLFCNGFFFPFSVQLNSQLYKVLPRYPFPSQYFRPLTFPYTEGYKDGHKSLYIYAEHVLREIEKEQDPSLN